jgi:hypothetical protein
MQKTRRWVGPRGLKRPTEKPSKPSKGYCDAAIRPWPPYVHGRHTSMDSLFELLWELDGKAVRSKGVAAPLEPEGR